jgi:predicted  nucleic acid-binding Zn-ribbon protein
VHKQKAEAAAHKLQREAWEAELVEQLTTNATLDAESTTLSADIEDAKQRIAKLSKLARASAAAEITALLDQLKKAEKAAEKAALPEHPRRARARRAPPVEASAANSSRRAP